MAYLPREDRVRIDGNKIGEYVAESSTELSYSFLKLSSQFIDAGEFDDVTRNRASEAVAALENAKAELYRVIINPSNAQRQFDFEG
jgi:hypothetical protein